MITCLMLIIYIVRKWYQARSDEEEAREERDRVYAWDRGPVETDSAEALAPLDEIPVGREKGFYFDEYFEDKDVRIERKEVQACTGRKDIRIEVKEIEVKEATEERERERRARGAKGGGGVRKKGKRRKGRGDG